MDLISFCKTCTLKCSTNQQRLLLILHELPATRLRLHGFRNVENKRIKYYAVISQEKCENIYKLLVIFILLTKLKSAFQATILRVFPKIYCQCCG